MTSIPMLHDKARNARMTVLLAHGSGLPMDSPFMKDMALRIAATGIGVLRFEFPYMAQRRTGGSRRPPPRGDTLCDFYNEAIGVARQKISRGEQLLIGGKSLGGRVASMVADAAFAAGDVQGLVCLGYPFHPPKKPDALRTAHLLTLTCPALFCQGTRDPLGTSEEIEGYDLSSCIEFEWLEDGDHDFKPRKRSGRTQEQNCQDAADAVLAFAASLP